MKQMELNTNLLTSWQVGQLFIIHLHTYLSRLQVIVVSSISGSLINLSDKYTPISENGHVGKS